MKTLRERWEAIRGWWQKTKEIEGWEFDVSTMQDVDSHLSRTGGTLPENVIRNGKKCPNCGHAVS